MEKLRIRRDAVSGEPEIQCFMEKLKQYLQVREFEDRKIIFTRNLNPGI